MCSLKGCTSRRLFFLGLIFSISGVQILTINGTVPLQRTRKWEETMKGLQKVLFEQYEAEAELRNKNSPAKDEI